MANERRERVGRFWAPHQKPSCRGSILTNVTRGVLDFSPDDGNEVGYTTVEGLGSGEQVARRGGVVLDGVRSSKQAVLEGPRVLTCDHPAFPIPFIIQSSLFTRPYPLLKTDSWAQECLFIVGLVQSTRKKMRRKVSDDWPYRVNTDRFRS